MLQGSALGLVSPVAVFCDWLKEDIRSVTSVCMPAHASVLADLSLRLTLHVAGWISNQKQ